MAKSQIRPPRRPRGEDPAVTIANQARQIDNLLERVSTLIREHEGAQKAHRMALDEISRLNMVNDGQRTEIERLRGVVAAASSSNQRMLGWQDCAREVFSELKMDT